MPPPNLGQKTGVSPPSILLFGQDLRLVETRRWVLEKAGFRLFTALQLADLDQIAAGQSIDLFLLCDSLSPEARKEALGLIHVRWPDAKLLVLTPAGPPTEVDRHIPVFSAMEGPRKLLSTINRLFTNDQEYTL